MSELVRGSPVPLFDRLSSVQGSDGSRHQLLTPEQLELSIGRELSRLLNTRSPLKPSEFSGSTGTTIDYGIPDISALSPKSHPDLDLLQSTIKQAVNHYEPRLKDVTVKAFPAVSGGGAATLLIGGTVTVGLKLRQLNFELQLDQRQDSRTKAA
jgi:type VI secretion system protein ImpF